MVAIISGAGHSMSNGRVFVSNNEDNKNLTAHLPEAIIFHEMQRPYIGTILIMII